MQYTPFASDLELPFYMALASRKINHDKLDDSPHHILGLYEIRPTDPPNVSCRLQVHGNALTNDKAPTGYYRAEGTIRNVNTIEEYRSMDKAQMLEQAGKMIWDAINDGSIYSCPSRLASFIVLSFADLKKFRFHYWFAFPALHSTPSWTPKDSDVQGTSGLNQHDNHNMSGGRNLSNIENSTLVDAVQTWSQTIDERQRGFFLARKFRDSQHGVRSTHETNRILSHAPSNTDPSVEPGFSWEISPLSAYEDGFFDGVPFGDCYVCFVDPSNYAHAPGWILRNLLVLVRRRWGLDTIQILRYRGVQSKHDHSRSTVMTLVSECQVFAAPRDKHDHMPKVTGWERNPAGKLAGRVVNLTEYLDPKRLADQSVDLNLKLMKWRISPGLDLEKIKRTRCLLLGAGTLGSYVARNLLGWGVTKITFVDNGSVSFSNPVRQPLFNFTDCLNGGTKKAHRAAEALSDIYPGVDSTGHVLSVPMAGHPIINEEKTRGDFELLKSLVDSHDAIFLLMDTRESRWLPTVMGKAAGKIVMNAALGFDTFVAMRHGVSFGGNSDSDLGCYFCNDVVAPVNSVRDQTLDQQCTVTRPGVAAIASALLVELFVSILQHPQGAAAPASAPRSEGQGNHPLGLVPHQIRGFLSTFENVSIVGRSYSCCSACSDSIVHEYKEQGWGFVQRALNEAGYVEELSGLKEVQLTAEATAADIEWDETDNEGEVEII